MVRIPKLPVEIHGRNPGADHQQNPTRTKPGSDLLPDPIHLLLILGSVRQRNHVVEDDQIRAGTINLATEPQRLNRRVLLLRIPNLTTKEHAVRGPLVSRRLEPILRPERQLQILIVRVRQARLNRPQKLPRQSLRLADDDDPHVRIPTNPVRRIPDRHRHALGEIRRQIHQQPAVTRAALLIDERVMHPPRVTTLNHIHHILRMRKHPSPQKPLTELLIRTSQSHPVHRVPVLLQLTNQINPILEKRVLPPIRLVPGTGTSRLRQRLLNRQPGLQTLNQQIRGLLISDLPPITNRRISQQKHPIKIVRNPAGEWGQRPSSDEKEWR